MSCNATSSLLVPVDGLCVQLGAGGAHTPRMKGGSGFDDKVVEQSGVACRVKRVHFAAKPFDDVRLKLGVAIAPNRVGYAPPVPQVVALTAHELAAVTK